MWKFFCILVLLVSLEMFVAPPVDKKKENNAKNSTEEMDDFGLEYGRYLAQVVQTLEEDKEFAKRLENITTDQIRSGAIAKELEFVKHNVRSKLDELKRIEVDRLRKLIQEQMERTELGLYRDGDGHLLNTPDGRRWRTIPSYKGLDRKNGVKIPKHLDIDNPHSFEMEDLKKLIQSATTDLEEIDRQRREEFKTYELEKEAAYRESLQNLTSEEKKKAEEHHKELIEKHKDHPKVHHPGSKPQLEQVWEEQDHLPKDEFNLRTFFAMHDLNGDGHLDYQEVEAVLIPEVRKVYNPNNEEDDPVEMMEDMYRMREHIFNQSDTNKDHLISLAEFLKMTEDDSFEQDEGWQGLDEQQVYSESELQEYMKQRAMQHHGDSRMYYDVGNAPQGMPPHINFQGHAGAPPPGYPQQPQGYPQQGHPQQFQQGYPQQGHPQQFQQGHPQQFQQGHPQQFQQGQPQHFEQGQPQQFQQGQPQHFQQGQPQQFQQGQHQQFQQGQHQQFQQGQPQQFPQGQPQQFPQGQPLQFQQGQPIVQQGQPQQVQQGQPQQFQQTGNNVQPSNPQAATETQKPSDQQAHKTEGNTAQPGAPSVAATKQQT
ncbi:nucleobindin-2 isoform X3 [Parasteatoda tepidariorum]|uniref:nucleobindin-2 isoform X2 n=1 Tax=Parasteatoda tepidariorum TaxID=114398 RepID=UPI001C728752|nr:nucleobindin-2 isoform X2 [Parasteatoda tepidariorum]XP_042895885.1 nucleobindin-2 isoform X3 [Parasteatoda tepidariorum]